MQHNHLCMLDVETVPDRAMMPDKVLRLMESDPKYFPPLPFHKVVAVSLVQAEIHRPADRRSEWYKISGIKSQGGDERDILDRLWRGYVPRIRPRFVTWNGRPFDFPVLKLRAMVHGIPAEYWHQAGDKYTNYSHRYSADSHCDLMDVLGDFGASRGLALDDMAMAMGLPGKIVGHGSQVETMINEGRQDDVCAYCEGDVLNLYCMYVRWAYLSGRTDAAGHNASMQSLVDYLRRERATRPHLGEFLEKWQASPRPFASMVEDEGLSLPGLALDTSGVQAPVELDPVAPAPGRLF